MLRAAATVFALQPTLGTSSPLSMWQGLQEPFITDSFFSRLKWEVQFQTQKFDAKLHALQSKGKGKANVTEARSDPSPPFNVSNQAHLCGCTDPNTPLDPSRS